MSYRAIGIGIALLALLSSGCQQCQVGRNIADYYHPEGQKPPVAQPPEPPKEPVASEAPVPGNKFNAFDSIAGNRFNSWTLSHRLDLPLKTEQAETP